MSEKVRKNEVKDEEKKMKKKKKPGLKQSWKNLGQYIFAIRELTGREIKRRYARSYLGIIWSVLNPVLSMAVISLVFSAMFRRSIDYFPLYYLTGQIFWNLFSDATKRAMTALVDNKSMLIKLKMPKHVFVLSREYTTFVNFGYTCIAYLLMLLLFQIPPKAGMLLFFPDVLLLMFFAMGFGYVLSILYVFFADISYLYSVLLTLWMYMSALFYPVDRLPSAIRHLVELNPIYLSVYLARESVVYGNETELSAWLRLGAWSFGSLLIGYIVFRRYENRVMQKL